MLSLCYRTTGGPHTGGRGGDKSEPGNGKRASLGRREETARRSHGTEERGNEGTKGKGSYVYFWKRGGVARVGTARHGDSYHIASIIAVSEEVNGEDVPTTHPPTLRSNTVLWGSGSRV